LSYLAKLYGHALVTHKDNLVCNSASESLDTLIFSRSVFPYWFLSLVTRRLRLMSLQSFALVDEPKTRGFWLCDRTARKRNGLHATSEH